MSEIARYRAALSLDFRIGSHLLHAAFKGLRALRFSKISEGGSYKPIEVRAQGSRRNGYNLVDQSSRQRDAAADDRSRLFGAFHSHLS